MAVGSEAGTTDRSCVSLGTFEYEKGSSNISCEHQTHVFDDTSLGAQLTTGEIMVAEKNNLQRVTSS
jgi:hypothetical protein